MRNTMHTYSLIFIRRFGDTMQNSVVLHRLTYLHETNFTNYIVFFFNDTATTEIYTLSLHDALPISRSDSSAGSSCGARRRMTGSCARSEEHTSELQSRRDLVCRLLLEKKKKKK